MAKTMGAFRGDRLKEVRRRRGFTQDELAARLSELRAVDWTESGDPPTITQQLVSWWETGRNEPSSELALLIARTLEESLDYLYGLTEKPGEYVIPAIPDNPLWERLVWAVSKGHVIEAFETLTALTKGEDNSGVTR